MTEAQQFYAWLVDDEDGEGLIATALPTADSTGITLAALVTTRRHNADAMRPVAREHGRSSGKTVRLVRFSRAEVIRELEP